ncbi:BTB domain-containing protein [Favolaschia claudopus]|uniref:BTB domain-containing protein n=1 Tax=Favolaschia claudopus TaxID=2862362 RepID=A0AAW0AFV9_9AGAR
MSKSPTAGNTNFRRSDIWFNDGNTVLQAGNTQFRVHLSVLALHSSVFSDMQGLPQPPNQPTIEGCPVVELQDDPKDVGFLLNALYIPTFHCQKSLPFSVVRALIRLGRKYDIKALFDTAVQRLTTEFPATLEEHDVLGLNYTVIDDYPGLELDVIALASETNIRTVLPYACYHAARLYNKNDFFDGVEKEDGTRTSLSVADIRRCVGVDLDLFMQQFQPGRTLGWARTWDFDDCTTESRCTSMRALVLAAYMEGSGTVFNHFVKPTELRLSQFCPACSANIEECIVMGRKKIWEDLPVIFNLPPWSELKNEG